MLLRPEREPGFVSGPQSRAGEVGPVGLYGARRFFTAAPTTGLNQKAALRTSPRAGVDDPEDAIV